MALNRSSLASLLVGVIAALVGFYLLDMLRRNSCVDNGGSWDAVGRACTLPPTVPAGAADVGLGTYALVVLAAAFLAFMLTRLYNLAAARGRQ